MSESCEKRHQSSRSNIFFLLLPPFCHSCRRRAKQSPKSPWSTPDPGDGRNHIISAVTQSHCQGVVARESIARVLTRCWIPRNTSDALSQPPARKPGCHSNELSKFHSFLRWRSSTLASYVLTKPAHLEMIEVGAMPACSVFNRTDLRFGLL